MLAEIILRASDLGVYGLDPYDSFVSRKLNDGPNWSRVTSERACAAGDSLDDYCTMPVAVA
jgi:hypothetical protein